MGTRRAARASPLGKLPGREGGEPAAGAGGGHPSLPPGRPQPHTPWVSVQVGRARARGHSAGSVLGKPDGPECGKGRGQARGPGGPPSGRQGALAYASCFGSCLRPPALALWAWHGRKWARWVRFRALRHHGSGCPGSWPDVVPSVPARVSLCEEQRAEQRWPRGRASPGLPRPPRAGVEGGLSSLVGRGLRTPGSDSPAVRVRPGRASATRPCFSGLGTGPGSRLSR